MRQNVLPRLVVNKSRPQLIEPITNPAPIINSNFFSPQIVNSEIVDSGIEITLAPPEITLAPIIDSTPLVPQIGNQEIAVKTRISEILKSPEIIYAVIATMVENIAHNDPNTFQNKQALKILQELTKESSNQDLFEDILKLSEFARDSKKLDRNFSLVADSIRLTAGAIALSSLIYESSKKVDDSEMGRLNSATEISLIISTATQIMASPITAYKGYQASIVGHFVEELSDAFESVASKLASKLGESKQNCLDQNHNHAKKDHQEGHCDHKHVSHAGSVPRHLGTGLNVTSMSISASSASYRFINFINKNTVNNLYTSTSALIAPIFSITGKTSSAKAAEIRKDEIKGKISSSQGAINYTCTKIFNETKKSPISQEETQEAIKLALVAIGKEAEEKTKEKRSKSGIKMQTKTLLTLIKDRVYGAPYNLVTYFRPTDGQTQNFGTQQDIEQNRKGTGWDLDLSKIKEKIGPDKLEQYEEKLEKFFSLKEIIRENPTTKRQQDSSPPSEHSTLFQGGELFDQFSRKTPRVRGKTHGVIGETPRVIECSLLIADNSKATTSSDPITRQ